MLRNDDKPVRLSQCGVVALLLVARTTVPEITVTTGRFVKMTRHISGMKLRRGRRNPMMLTQMRRPDLQVLNVLSHLAKPI